jgi:glycosyltransferase involved in cell wall biosynthesis
MGRPSDSSRLHVVIDARLQPGQTGGVEGVVVGLANGLSSLTDGPERYTFVAWDGWTDWLMPHLSGASELVTVPLQPPSNDGPSRPPGAMARFRKRVGEAAPVLRETWRRTPWRKPYEGPPRSDQFVAALRPNVVHFPFQRGFLTKIPTIFHPHDLQHVHLPEFFSEDELAYRELWYGTLCRHAAMVAVASEWVARDVREHFRLPVGRVRVVPLAPPTAAYPAPRPDAITEARRRLDLPDRYVLYPAQTWPHKNHGRLLEALAMLRQTDGLQIPLVATGRQTELFPELERLALELGLGESVKWLGFLPPEDLLAVYTSARGVVIPSLFEAASAPLWEAFRARVPAACSNVTSLPEQAGDAALLFDPLDTTQIAHAVRDLWCDERLRDQLTGRGTERVKAYSWEKTARTFRAHYRRLARRALTDEDRLLIESKAVV